MSHIKWNIKTVITGMIGEVNNLNRFDAVFFDVDGTLLDSAPGILHTMQEAFERMGTDVSHIDLTKYMGPPLRKTFAEHYNTEAEIEQAVGYYRTSYAVKGCHECSLFDGAKEMLDALRQAGVLLYTATSKPTKVVTPMLHEQGIANYFVEIGGASMGKDRDTKADVIRWLLRRPELQGKRILMVGDRKEDLQGAAECGLPGAAVLYGYGSLQELQPFDPVILAKDPAALTSYILKGE